MAGKAGLCWEKAAWEQPSWFAEGVLGRSKSCSGRRGQTGALKAIEPNSSCTPCCGPFVRTVTARQALVLRRKLLPAAGDKGRAALLQLRTACKPRGSEKGLEGKQALLKTSYRDKGMAHPTGSRLTPGLCLGQVLCPRICSGLEEWRGEQGRRCHTVLGCGVAGDQGSQSARCVHPVLCVVQSTMLQLCPSGYCSPSRSWRHAHIGDSPACFLGTSLSIICWSRPALSRVGSSSVSAVVLIWLGTSCLRLVQAGR